MAIFIVSYDLNAPGQNYQPLYDALESVIHCHPLDSFWLIDVDQSAVEVREALRSFMDSNDSIAVIEFTPDADWACYLAGADIQWIKRRRP
jgi:hypothetical protein